MQTVNLKPEGIRTISEEMAEIKKLKDRVEKIEGTLKELAMYEQFGERLESLKIEAKLEGGALYGSCVYKD